jgi:hypothetical protein
MHRKGNSHFGSLSALKKLNRLSIQPETLLGGCFGDPMAPFCLRETLPPTLKDLTFYGDEGLLRNEGLGDQICKVVESPDFMRLKSIVLEDVSHLNHHRVDPIQLPYQKVKQACRERMIGYRKVKGKKLLKGGSSLPCFRKASVMRINKSDKWSHEQEQRFTAERRRQIPESGSENSEGLDIERQDSDTI